MTPGEVAPWGIAGVLTLKEAYGFFTAGQKFDDRVKKHIAEDKANNVKADDLQRQMTQKEFEHMAGDIRRISDSIADILRMLRESVATKQDILQHDFRLDNLEESNREHYESFKAIREDFAALQVACAKLHRSGDTHGVKKESIR